MPLRKKPIRSNILPKFSPNVPKAGLLVMDLSLKPIAYDRGAGAMLKAQSCTTLQSEPPLFPPREVLEMVSNLNAYDQSSIKVNFRMGNSEYTCTSYLLEVQEKTQDQLDGKAGPGAMVALYIEKIPSAIDAVSAVASKYNLTQREKEALSLLSMGFCSKKLAEKMNISPNTVKVFLRLIMLKMGVSTRGEIVAEIIQNQNIVAGSETAPRAVAARV